LKSDANQTGLENTYVYDEENRLTDAYLKGAFTVDTSKEILTAWKAEEDLFGDNQLIAAVPEDEIRLDYAAGSIGVDLGDEYLVTRVDLLPRAAGNRVTPDAITRPVRTLKCHKKISRPPIQPKTIRLYCG
jgi:hypothetical protein